MLPWRRGRGRTAPRSSNTPHTGSGRNRRRLVVVGLMIVIAFALVRRGGGAGGGTAKAPRGLYGIRTSIGGHRPLTLRLAAQFRRTRRRSRALVLLVWCPEE